MREAAAKAFAHLISTNDTLDTIRTLSSQIPNLRSTGVPWNRLHGVLLQIYSLIQLHSGIEKLAETISQIFDEKSWLLRESPSMCVGLIYQILERLTLTQQRMNFVFY